MVHLNKKDIVRNPIVQRIIDAYDEDKARLETVVDG